VVDHAEDRGLMMACRRGDEASARLLHARVFPLLSAVGAVVTGDASLGEDAAQNALMRMLRTPFPLVALVRRPRAWLCELTRREALMLRRGRVRADRRERHAAAPEPFQTSEEVGTHPRNPGLHEAVARLSPEHQHVVILKHRAGLTFDEMGAVLGISRDTLASRYRAALERLRGFIAEQDTTNPQEARHAT
jgi:RNA polymerase sigma factor (sigma-70 family)